MNKMKNAIEAINIKRNQAEGRICELQNRIFDIIQSEGKKGRRMKKNEENLCDLCNTFKRRNEEICKLLESQKDNRWRREQK